MKIYLKALVGVTLVAVAAVANAQISLNLVSYGSWALGGAIPNTAFTDTETVLYPPSNTGGLPQLNNLSASFANFAPIGVAAYTSAGNELDLDLLVTDFETSADGLTNSLDGVWSYSGGIGAYAGFAVGDGTFAITQSDPPGGGGGISETVLMGTLYATPEPGAYLVLGAGVLGLMVRRKRTAKR